MSSGLPGSKCLLSKWYLPPRCCRLALANKGRESKLLFHQKEQKSCCGADTVGRRTGIVWGLGGADPTVGIVIVKS
jgi:hypothetical protein